MKLKPLEKVALSLFIFSVTIAILVLAKVVLNPMENELGLNRKTIESNVEKATSNITSKWQQKVGGVYWKTSTTLFQIGILPVFIFLKIIGS